MKKNIAVIFGGKSTEHDISILTALQVCSALDKQKYDVLPLYIDNNGIWYTGCKLLELDFYTNYNAKKLKEVSILPSSNVMYIKALNKFKRYKKIDCAIIACHGKNGEDGTIQGLLELSNIPYTSTGVMGSAIGIDKACMKKVFESINVPICKYVEISKTVFKNLGAESILENLDLPLIVKPNSLGSSIGISVCNSVDDLQQALELAFLFDDKVVVEKLITNLKEVNISVLGNGADCVCSVTEEPQANGKLLSFEKKYLQSGKVKTKNSATKIGMQNIDRVIPANINYEQTLEIENLSKKIFEKLDCKGVVRIDFMIDLDNNKIYANEINTIPGSFAFYLWEKTELNFNKLLDGIIEIAINNNRDKNKLITTFQSSVLNKNSKSIK